MHNRSFYSIVMSLAKRLQYENNECNSIESSNSKSGTVMVYCHGSNEDVVDVIER